MTRLRIIAALCLTAWLLHAAELLHTGTAWDLLWTCNVAPLLVAAGCWLERGMPVAVGLCWLIYGTPMWVLDMLGGGDIMLSSFGSHLGVLAIGLFAMRGLGWPRRSWLAAIAGATAVVALTRLVAPPASNVNLVFRVWEGWQDSFPRHDVYFAIMWLGGGLSFFVVERLYLWLSSAPTLEPQP
jgi:hypothetical protein